MTNTFYSVHFGIISIKMISIKCEDEFLKRIITSFLEQKNFIFKKKYLDKYFFQLNFYQEENKLNFSIDDDEIKISLPKNNNEIFQKIYDFVSNRGIVVNNYKYFPFKQIMKKENKISFLSEIQNEIMIHLLLNLSDGIDKIELIKNIWPNDKDIFLNKLDTHLTNLKNQLSKDIDFKLKFSSKSSLLKLSIY